MGAARYMGRSTGSKTQRSLQRISEANLKHGRQTKDKLAAQHHAAEGSQARGVQYQARAGHKQVLGRLTVHGAQPRRGQHIVQEGNAPQVRGTHSH